MPLVYHYHTLNIGDVAIPAPRIRAAVDSLSVLAAEPVALGAGIDGDMAMAMWTDYSN